MQIRYICGHTTDVAIHKDRLEVVNVRHKCNDCRIIKIIPEYVSVVIGIHTLVIKRAQRREQTWETSGSGSKTISNRRGVG